VVKVVEYDVVMEPLALKLQLVRAIQKVQHFQLKEQQYHHRHWEKLR